MIIYGPRFFLWHEGINNNEKLRALNNNRNVQIKQRYYIFNSFKRCCVFLCVLCFALLNQIVPWPISKDFFFVFVFSQLLFMCFKFNTFVFIICLCFFIATNKTHSKIQIESNEKKKMLHCKIQRAVNTCLLYTSPSPRDKRQSRMPSSA